MNIIIKSTNMEPTPAIKDYAEKRISKAIVKYSTDAADLSIEVAKTTNHHKNGDVFMAETNVTTPLGTQYRAVSEKPDLYEAIDDVRDTLVRELNNSKDKKENLWRRSSRAIKKMVRKW